MSGDDADLTMCDVAPSRQAVLALRESVDRKLREMNVVGRSIETAFDLQRSTTNSTFMRTRQRARAMAGISSQIVSVIDPLREIAFLDDRSRQRFSLNYARIVGHDFERTEAWVIEIARERPDVLQWIASRGSLYVMVLIEFIREVRRDERVMSQIAGWECPTAYATHNGLLRFFDSGPGVAEAKHLPVAKEICARLIRSGSRTCPCEACRAAADTELFPVGGSTPEHPSRPPAIAEKEGFVGGCNALGICPSLKYAPQRTEQEVRDGLNFDPVEFERDFEEQRRNAKPVPK